nr:PQQ-binding-like beta-propeller repeat protein [Streptomyces coelicoflavus]
MVGLTGCSEAGPEADNSASDASSAAKPRDEAKGFDPPVEFGKAVKLPVDEQVKSWGFAQLGPRLYERTAAALNAYDTSSGRRLWSSPLGRKDWYTGTAGGVSDDQRIPPVFAQHNGRTEVLFAYADYTKGSGTEVDRTDVYLRAVDADTGKVSWTTRLPGPGKSTVSDLEPAVVGAQDGTAVVRVLTSTNDSSEDSESATTYAVDLNRRQVMWQEERFAAGALDSGVVIGAQLGEEARFQSLLGWHSDQTDLGLVGRTLEDGTPLWKQEGRSSAEIEPVGGGFFATGPLRDSRTGETVPGGTDGTLLHCVYDQRSVVVCDSEETVRGIDARTRKVLWTISADDSSRKKPRVGNAWHGAVYAGTDTTGVILDARTGKDLRPFSGGSPYTINQYAAVSIDMVVYPATG